MVNADPVRTEENELAVLVGPFWSEVRVMEALGVPSRGALAARRRRGSVLGVRSADGVWMYPLWQFQRRGGVEEVRPGLVAVLREWTGLDGWTVAVLLQVGAVELEGLSPLGWLREGRPVDGLVWFARVVAREMAGN